MSTIKFIIVTWIRLNNKLFLLTVRSWVHLHIITKKNLVMMNTQGSLWKIIIKHDESFTLQSNPNPKLFRIKILQFDLMYTKGTIVAGMRRKIDSSNKNKICWAKFILPEFYSSIFLESII